MATRECENLRVGHEYLQSVAWPSVLRQQAHDRCYCKRCYSSTLPDTLTVAGYKYVIPRGWTRFAVSVDEPIAQVHNVWKTWLNCYHGTSIENARSAVEHRQLLLPSDVTLAGKKLKIREGHIPGENYVFTTPSITYAALEYYAHTYTFESPNNSRMYTIKVVLQCKQKADSITVQPETVGARAKQIEICPHIPNEELEWKTQNRSAVLIYGLMLEIKPCNEDDSPTETIPIPDQSPPLKQTRDAPQYSLDISTDSDEIYFTKKKIAILIILILFTLLPVAALVLSQIYKADCPIEPRISFWLFIFGVVGAGTFLLLFFIALITFRCCSERLKIGRGIGACLLCLLILFFLAWLIMGSIWVFPLKAKVQFDPSNTENYCQKILYMFIFGLLLAQYGCIALLACTGVVTAAYFKYRY
ncbi:unnamed protein product [Adineta ricciae]|uniref:Uncharacterized protein n=2 Tax=Adineta ricciae TaxID=249248 RepID=A0A814ML93_ADIRI|nr:unnamed protein product [Adineta ricciae]